MQFNLENYRSRWDYKVSFQYDLSARKRAVLVLVTDDAAYAETVKPVLVEAGFDVKLVDNERDAQHVTFSVLPDLILVDRLIENGAGNEVMRRLKSQPHLGKIPVYLARQSGQSMAGTLMGTMSSSSRATAM